MQRSLFLIGSLFTICMLISICVMFDTQIIHGDEYYDRAHLSTTHSEKITASRGIITDRNGKVLVSNRPIYAMRLDLSRLNNNADWNTAIARLQKLCEENVIQLPDNLPLSLEAPFTYSYGGGSTSEATLRAFVVKKKWADESFSFGTPGELTAQHLFSRLRTEYGIAPTMSNAAARKIIGIRYEMDLAKMEGMSNILLAEDISVSFISLLKDGNYQGVYVDTISERQYETEYAAHILGYTGKIPPDLMADYKEKGYAMDAVIGRDGIEKAYENYLHGTDGTRVVTVNKEGKIIDENYSVMPQPGNTVALTLDIDFQKNVEQILAGTIEQMNAEDELPRGGAAAVVSVNSGEVLALASYPTFSLERFNQEYSDLLADPLNPLYNRATQGTYPPGSTFKPCTAIAALETGIITPTTRIFTRGQYAYYDLRLNCWLYSRNGGTHGRINVTQAITDSCNYFFYDVGRMTGIGPIARYASALGLGEATGIEIPENIGVMTTPDYVNSLEGHYWTDGQTLTAAIGQSYSLFSPLQLANYTATLANGGTRYPAHLLKNIRASGSPELTAIYNNEPIVQIDFNDANIHAVLEGMHDLTVSGSVAYYFRSCIVDAAAKTGTAQTGGDNRSNGVFICYAPYDAPEIALAIVIEKGGSGSALASTAVNILNAYFAPVNHIVSTENTLLK